MTDELPAKIWVSLYESVAECRPKGYWPGGRWPAVFKQSRDRAVKYIRAKPAPKPGDKIILSEDDEDMIALHAEMVKRGDRVRELEDETKACKHDIEKLMDIANGYINGSEFQAIEQENFKLKKALKAIKKHQEILGGTMGNKTTTWQIANKALENKDANT